MLACSSKIVHVSLKGLENALGYESKILHLGISVTENLKDK